MFRIAVLLLLVSIFISCHENNQPKNHNLQVSSCAGTKISDKDWYTSEKKAPIFDGLNGIDFKITTIHPEAQRYFNQGMMLTYGFNHAEAARSFFEASRLDSTCAMAFWGLAYVLGPNYNARMEQDNYQPAFEAISKAKLLSDKCSPMEVALIDALTYRYEIIPPSDRSPLDRAYAEAMKKVYIHFPIHPDIGALYADALMNLHPWDLYENRTQAPKQWTPEIVQILEQLIKANPNHPGAHHLYIHALEASANPEKAISSAHLLNTLVPGSGHLLHMPSHIYINTGDYHLGTQANLRAISVDSIYISACNAQGAYPLAYSPHNYHFLTATAALEGQSALSYSAAEQLQQHLALDLLSLPEWSTLQHYYTIPYYIAVKFSMWDKILSFSTPPEDLIYPNAILHYARGLAYISKNDVENAQKEATKLKKHAKDTSLTTLTVWNINTLAELVHIAEKVLTAAIATKKNEPHKSLELLREAVNIEDGLNYNEPPDWFFSVRHHLGAVYLETNNYQKAESIYLEDLQKWKKNGWALIGLYKALVKQNKITEANKTKIKFDQVWQHADFEITSSSNIF